MLASLLVTNGIPTGSSTIVELGLLREIGGFDPDLLGCEDWEMWIRLAQHSPLAAVDLPLVAYRLGLQTASMDVNRMRTSRVSVVKRYAELAASCAAKPDEATHERYLAKQLLRAGAGWRAASIFMSLACKHGRLRELPRAAAALAAPRLTDRVGRARATAAVPEKWRRDAETWLAPIRQANKVDSNDSRSRINLDELRV
jgi:hypothetical protein